jgi:peptide/nickel transport system permease protein
VIVLLWLGTAVLGPTLVRNDPNDQELIDALQPPSFDVVNDEAHLLGTDQLGRDILSRIVYGAGTSLQVGAIVVAIGAILGSAIGLIAAEWGGMVDEVLMRLADVQLATPFLLLAITMLALFGGSMVNMVLVLTLSTWVIYARVVRSELLHIREQEFVLAARALGAPRPRVVLHHLLPNALGLIIVLASLELSNIILLEAALSFLGAGLQPPLISLGAMVSGGRDYLAQAWWVATIPGAALAVMVLGANFVGDWLRDVLDPRRQL